jgi:hypothetical protein
MRLCCRFPIVFERTQRIRLPDVCECATPQPLPCNRTPRSPGLEWSREPRAPSAAHCRTCSKSRFLFFGQRQYYYTPLPHCTELCWSTLKCPARPVPQSECTPTPADVPPPPPPPAAAPHA